MLAAERAGIYPEILIECTAVAERYRSFCLTVPCRIVKSAGNFVQFAVVKALKIIASFIGTLPYKLM